MASFNPIYLPKGPTSKYNVRLSVYLNILQWRLNVYMSFGGNIQTTALLNSQKIFELVFSFHSRTRRILPCKYYTNLSLKSLIDHIIL
jgi:hypothetical protein